MTPVVEAVLNDPGSPSVGPPLVQAAVTIVLFTDYQCSICKATDPALQAVIDEQTDIRVIFKDWPIFGDLSKVAAKAALAAAAQGKYRAVHQALMGNRGPLDPSRIEQLAIEAGADRMELRRAQTAGGEAYDRQLAKHAFQAFSLGLQGTPAYLVGPFLIEGGLDQRRLEQVVRTSRQTGFL